VIFCTDSYANPNTDSDTYTDTNRYSHSYLRVYANTYSYSHAHTDAKRYSNSYGYLQVYRRRPESRHRADEKRELLPVAGIITANSAPIPTSSR
jgi:hypothetical protein